MRRYLHSIALVLLGLSLLFDLVLWGAVPDLPEVGPQIAHSAHSEAILASTYMALGGYLDAAIRGFHEFGTHMMSDALSPGFPRIIEDPNVAMDLILNSNFNRSHGWVKTLYWAPPILLVVFAVLFALRPKQVKLIRTR